MKSFHESMIEYKKQLQNGDIQDAYRGLMEYFRDLRSYFRKKYPDYSISSSIYYGYMDMTYFSFNPESIKRRNLKIAIVFVHDKFRFEVWLAALNKNVQAKYWKLLKESGWNQYHIAKTTKGFDSILDHVLVNDPDFSDLVALTTIIEEGTLKFTRDIEDFLSEQ